MTLVIGACVADAVILGADSLTQVISINEGKITNISSRIDRKLFKLTRAGIATHGSGLPNMPVPAVLTDELNPEWSVSEVIRFLQRRFKGADEMGALVGGLDATGNPVLFDVSMSGSEPQQIVRREGCTSPLVLKGVKNLQQDQQPPGTVTSVLAQMLALLNENSGHNVGPPYEFLVIPARVAARDQPA
jgi:hypothetical protein